MQDYTVKKEQNDIEESIIEQMRQLLQCARCFNAYTIDEEKEEHCFKPSHYALYCSSYETFSATAEIIESTVDDKGVIHETCKGRNFPCVYAIELNVSGDCEMFEDK